MKKKVNYNQHAQSFLVAIGGQSNITNYVHCFTRMRYEVIDKTLVDIETIKQNPIAKGINWNGDQLQIILGSGVVEEVYKETQNLLAIPNSAGSGSFELKEKIAQKRKRGLGPVFTALGDIFLPIIPALVSAGLLMGFKALFVQLKIIEVGTTFEQILNILTSTAFAFLAALVCWSTVKRFGGTPVIGIIIGIMFVSPILPDKNAVATWDYYQIFIKGYPTIEAAKEAWTASGLAIPVEVLAWKIGFITIVGWQGSVLPPIALGILAAVLEKNLKKVVPKSLNMIITPFITITVTFVMGLFVFGPLLQVVEKGILIGATSFLKIPYGFGTALLAGTLQAIVITGAHQLLQGLEMQMVIEGQITGNGSIMNAVWTASIVSQGGAAFAVAFLTKNKVDSKLHLSAGLTSLFGITEPVIFGTNLPRVKPFLYGLVGGAAGGFIAGIFNVTCPGMGVTVIPGLLLYSGQPSHLIGILGVNIVGFGTAFLLTLFLFSNNINIKNKFNQNFKKIGLKTRFKNKVLVSQYKQFIKQNHAEMNANSKVINEYQKQTAILANWKLDKEELLDKLEIKQSKNNETAKLETLIHNKKSMIDEQILLIEAIKQKYDNILVKQQEIVDDYKLLMNKNGITDLNLSALSVLIEYK
ncbi:PTS sugar transporter subunit IIA [Mesoplasma syrphidae]|uniref:PTS sugar transporter subunit IIA n=1 Tax=Mesoplasma syrphidae TaxID=225999 RepID=A0A2K9BJT5_9MOLU|nr:PTS transporter subunit EIIC [Mesoplasma syrphidae]AUF83526.1 PTS sugar transporter subunit IIA [Mesoplasma syrphidae]